MHYDVHHIGPKVWSNKIHPNSEDQNMKWTGQKNRMGLRRAKRTEKEKYIVLHQVYAVEINKGEQLFWNIHYCGQ